VLAVADLGAVELTAEDVIVTETPREGWTVAAADGETIALDLTLTADLVAAGLAREVVRFLQETRKNAGFDVSDRIEVRWTSDDSAAAAAVHAHGDMIAEEVLAETFTAGTLPAGAAAGDWFFAQLADPAVRAAVRRTG
jgi:isoleucyl-tRNA synthetase